MPLAEYLGASRINECGAFLEISRIEHLLNRAAHGDRVSHMCIRVGKAQLHRFDLQMLARGAVHRMSRHTHVLQDTERNERRDALPVRWNLVQTVPIAS